MQWDRDQPQPSPEKYTFRPGYSDHTYQNFSAPLSFDGFGLDAIRAAISQHRLGYFWQSSALKVSILGFAPVLAALQQRVAPILGLARHVRGGDRGLAKMISAEVEDALVPRGGLEPSRYVPPHLWGTMAINLALMNFQVLQHVDGDPDPETGVRPRFTRTWPEWAVQMYRSPRKVIALTTEGPVEICNDGKFTLVAYEEEPHLSSAICALGEEAFAGKFTQENRLNFLYFFGNPKLWGTLPEKVSIDGDDGKAFVYSVNEVIYGPDGRGVLPYGSKLEAVGISGEGSRAFDGALADAVIRVFMVLTGSAGTIGNTAGSGAGPYQPAKNGAWNVASHLYTRDTLAIVRGLNGGHVAPYLDQNYGEAIAGAKRAGVWVDPVLTIPIPSPDRDERIESELARMKGRGEELERRRANGIVVTQTDLDVLSETLDLQKVRLVAPGKAPITADDMTRKLFSPDEYRAQKGFDPLPNDAGTVERLAEEREQGGDETGALGKVRVAETRNEGPPKGAPAPAAPKPEGDGPPTQPSGKAPG